MTRRPDLVPALMGVAVGIAGAAWFLATGWDLQLHPVIGAGMLVAGGFAVRRWAR